MAPPKGCARGGCRCWELLHAEGVCQRGAPEPCRGGAREGVCRFWKLPHALGGLLCGRRGAPEGCAIALPRGRAGGGSAGGMSLLGAAACPGRPPMWAGGVCHCPAKGVCQR